MSAWDPGTPAFEPAQIVGHPWTVDWRDQVPVTPDYQGYGGELAFLNLSSMTGWGKHTGLVETHPLIPGYGGGDPLQLTSQGELRAGSTIAWPTDGQMGVNNEVPILDLANEAGVDVGLQLWTGPGPRMVFLPPPSYGEQTTPIPAVGV